MTPSKLIEEALYALAIVCITVVVCYGVIGMLSDIGKWINWIVSQSP